MARDSNVIVGSNRAAILDRVSDAAFQLGRSETVAISAITVAGTSQADTRRSFMLGYIAARLDRTTMSYRENSVEAEALLSKPGPYQTGDEKRIMSAARVAWHRLLKRAGVKTEETRGGSRFGPALDKPDSERADFDDSDVETSFRTPTQIWCSNCDSVQPCRSIHPGDAVSFRGESTGSSSSDQDPAINWFQRIRRCESCNEEFLTAEVEFSIFEEIRSTKEKLQFIEQENRRMRVELETISQELEISLSTIGGRIRSLSKGRS